MKKIKNGFFLAETIIMIALVTTVIAFLYPNVAKLYDNYTNRVNTYDQVNDIYTLRAIKEYFIQNPTILQSAANELSDEKKLIEITLNEDIKIGNIKKLYISKYMEIPNHLNYNFNKYLNRMKKTTYSPYSYRLIGIFDKNKTDGNYGEKTTYASIKISEADISFGGY